MNSKMIVEFIYSLFNRGIRAWANAGNIKFFIPSGACLSKSEKLYITENKSRIVALLAENNVYRRLNSTPILKADATKAPLSFSQERLWFIEQYEAGSNIYNIPRVYQLLKGFSMPALKYAIRQVLNRHEILRTFIQTDKCGHAYQVVDEMNSAFEISKHNILSKGDLRIRIIQEVRYVFDLENEYPIRVCVYELSNEEAEVPTFYLSIVLHHIAADGWSMGILSHDLNAYYNAYRKTYYDVAHDISKQIKPLNIQYKDFTIWQRNHLTDVTLEHQLSYWSSKLSGYEQLDLPLDKPRPDKLDYVGDDICFKLSVPVSETLRLLAKNLDVSLYAILLAAFYLLLKLYSNQNDLVIGTVLANRHYDSIDELIGFFVNTLVLRVISDDHDSVMGLVQQVADEILAIQSNQDLPFEKLVEALQVPKDTGRHPIFQVMFVLQGFSAGSEDMTQGFLQPYDYLPPSSVAKFDLTTTWDESADQLECNLNYRTSLFHRETIENYIHEYQNILEQFSKLAVHDIEQAQMVKLNSIESLSLATPVHGIVASDFPSDSTLFQLFEDRASIVPDKIAIVDSQVNREYSYGVLARDMAYAAKWLVEDSSSGLIAILSEKGYKQAVGSLAIMKSGCAYLPLHHEWPVDRLMDVLANGEVKTILISRLQYQSKEVRTRLERNYQLIIIEDLLDQVAETPHASTALQSVQFPVVKSSDIAYVIFTSGSTGKPKGVTISHRGAVNTIYTVNQTYNVSMKDSILALSELSFDLSVYDIFGLLSVGGTVIFPDSEDVKDPSVWLNLIATHKITLWDSVPQLANLLVHEAELTGRSISTLRLFLLSGDWIPINLPGKIKSHCVNTDVVSLGGATEGSIWSIWYPIKEIDPSWSSIPYGFAMQNQGMYVLDSGFNHCPVGLRGEIFIAGAGVALNYWKDPTKTAESFIIHPELGRIYRTGDLGKRHKEGYIEYLGRKDTQIKLNGYRIELGDIATKISGLPGVDDAVVVLKEKNNTPMLVAYYAGEKQCEVSLLMALKGQLPEYMLPEIICHLDQIPLSANGKVNRPLLPELISSSSELVFVAPRSDLEVSLCSIYEELLRLNEGSVSITDDFFKLGGDSILSIQLVSQLKQKLQLVVTVKDVFSAKCVEQLAETILAKREFLLCERKSEQGVLTGDAALLPIQEWFFSSGFSSSNHFNHAFMIKVPELEITRLEASLIKLVEYHDALRLRFKFDDDRYHQYYGIDFEQVALKILDINSLSSSGQEDELALLEILTHWQQNFNIEDGPLFSVGYIHGYPDGNARVHFALHHLIVDTISWRIIANDLKLIYEGLSALSPGAKESSALPEKGTSYRQWADVVAEYTRRLDSGQEKRYWAGILDECQKHENFLEKLANDKHEKNTSSFKLNVGDTQLLLQKSMLPYNTQINDVLLTALACSLLSLTGNNVNCVTLEGHGREEIDMGVDINRTVGWFTTMYPVRLELHQGLELSASLKLIKEMLRQVPNKGLGYGSIMGLKGNHLPKVNFNYLGQFDNASSGKDWQICNENSGLTVAEDNFDSSIITINAAVIDEQFHFSVMSKLDQKDVDAFCNSYQRSLDEIVCYLVEKSGQEYTMSDFSEYESHTYISKTMGQKTNLFMFPPGVGGYECYLNNIASTLDADLVMFNNFNYYLREELGERAVDKVTFESLAETYIAQMKVIQPSGPYVLFGWSFGGVLAFEIARQLAQAGNEVSHLFMVDPYFKVKQAYEQLALPDTDMGLVGHLNHEYQPTDVSFSQKMEVVLFKAIEEHSVTEGNPTEKIFNHYVAEAEYNYLDKIINKDLINLVPLGASHFNWVKNAAAVNMVSDFISNRVRK